MTAKHNMRKQYPTLIVNNKHKIKVAFIFGALGGGGAQRQFGHLINNINRDHFHPIIISIGRSESETGNKLKPTLKLLKLNSKIIICIGS